jgi:hypothetical protein
MKKHILGIALATLAFVGCNETPHPVPQTITIDFESASLNEQGISYGADSGRKDATGTYNIYSQTLGGARLDTWMQTEPYFTWWGWAASHNVGDEYKADYSHQYECPSAAASGENFAVCYFSDYNQTLYRPAIQFAKNVDVESLKNGFEKYFIDPAIEQRFMNVFIPKVAQFNPMNNPFNRAFPDTATVAKKNAVKAGEKHNASFFRYDFSDTYYYYFYFVRNIKTN